MAYMEGRVIFPILGEVIPYLGTNAYIFRGIARGDEMSTIEGVLTLVGGTAAMLLGMKFGMYLDRLTMKRNNNYNHPLATI